MHVACTYVERAIKNLEKGILILTFGRGRVSKSWDQLQNKGKMLNFTLVTIGYLHFN
jgi:hypothetical protein